jgi:uncharacterized Ntn-hydrolase superfamily protein
VTYSIIARCPRTGQFGIGIASYSIAIGINCDAAVRANTGVTLTLGSPRPQNNHLALKLLAQGRTAGQVLEELRANDPDSGWRQTAIVDRESVAAYSGVSLRQWAGHRTGSDFAVSGDGLAGPQVLDAMATAYEAAAHEGLDERLLAALEAGRQAGGLVGAGGRRLPERSAAMVVWAHRTYNEVDLRVDVHDNAVTELRRIYVDYKPSIAYYEERARNPRNAIPAMEFADMLKKQQTRAAA